MLSRSAVAKLLDCSIATVRRLEGHELFPRRDRSGVLRFDLDEVNAVARRLRTGRVPAARGDWLSNRRHARSWPQKGARKASTTEIEGCEEMARLRDENTRLKEELAEMAAASAELFEQIEALCDD
ncbi:MAG TPA: hypothetical protein VER96_17410 [Polyangiaceae bacterium]|nr:hypothetical protein [Polyangiaceae bacterium]